jgi:hypothetical protein
MKPGANQPAKSMLSALCSKNDASLANGLFVVVLASTCAQLEAQSHNPMSGVITCDTQAQTADSSFPLLCTELLWPKMLGNDAMSGRKDWDIAMLH